MSELCKILPYEDILNKYAEITQNKQCKEEEKDLSSLFQLAKKNNTALILNKIIKTYIKETDVIKK